MREQDHAAPPDDGGHHGSYATPEQAVVASNVNAPPAHNVPVTRTGPSARDLSTQRSALSSPVLWLSLATLLAAVIVYLFLARGPDTTDTMQRSEPQQAPLQR